MNFLSEKRNVLFEHFLKDYTTLFDIDVLEAKRLVKTDELFQRLTKEWYKHLHDENMVDAFAVYNDDYYFIDIFLCYTTYSREYIKKIIKHAKFAELAACDSIIDIGCGIGYSTATLKQIMPNVKAYAVNLKDTKQWKFCEIMAKRHDFQLIDDIDKAGKVDIVFASEFFEHISNPIAYIDNIVKSLDPKYMIIANSFGTWSIGHFENYWHEHARRTISQNKMEKEFNKYLKYLGFINVGDKIWNNKPKIWQKVS